MIHQQLKTFRDRTAVRFPGLIPINSSQKVCLFFAPSTGCAVGMCLPVNYNRQFLQSGMQSWAPQLLWLQDFQFCYSFFCLGALFSFFLIKLHLLLPCNYETPLSFFLTTVKIPSPTTMAITVGVRWALRMYGQECME